MLDIHGLLAEHRREQIRVRRPARLGDVGALTAQAADTIVFEDLPEHPRFRLVDDLFLHRRAQARVLGCEPDRVVPRSADVLRHGPRPLRVVDGGPCHERVIAGDDVDLAALPVVRYTGLDPYPYTTSFAVHRDPETGVFGGQRRRPGTRHGPAPSGVAEGPARRSTIGGPVVPAGRDRQAI